MKTETWTWGDLFELDMPLDALVHPSGDTVELKWAGNPDKPLFLAVFSPTDEQTEQVASKALIRFAASRGLLDAEPEVTVDEYGVAVARLTFKQEQVWQALAIAWNTHLLVAFIASDDPEDPLFARSWEVLETWRPLEMIVPRQLEPEEEGDF